MDLVAALFPLSRALSGIRKVKALLDAKGLKDVQASPGLAAAGTP